MVENDGANIILLKSVTSYRVTAATLQYDCSTDSDDPRLASRFHHSGSRPEVVFPMGRAGKFNRWIASVRVWYSLSQPLDTPWTTPGDQFCLLLPMWKTPGIN